MVVVWCVWASTGDGAPWLLGVYGSMTLAQAAMRKMRGDGEDMYYITMWRVEG